MLRSITILLAGAALCAAAVVNTTDRGYYYNYDFHDGTNKNYITGQLTVNQVVTDFHSYFAFAPLGALAGSITGATLYLFNPAGGYSSTQASETLIIDGFTGSLATLESTGTNSGEFAALASGTTFGSVTVSSANNNAFIPIPLNSAALAFLNSQGATSIAFGGYLSGIADNTSRFVFGGSSYMVANDGNTYLSLVTSASSTPEPATIMIILGAIVLFLTARWYRMSPQRPSRSEE
jgi:hypothetical protein